MNRDRETGQLTAKRRPGARAQDGAADRGDIWRRWVTRIVVVVGFVAFVLVAAYLVNRGVDWYQERATTTTQPEARGHHHQSPSPPGCRPPKWGACLKTKGSSNRPLSSSTWSSRGAPRAPYCPGKYGFSEGLALVEVVDMLERGRARRPSRSPSPKAWLSSQVAARLTDDGRHQRG